MPSIVTTHVVFTTTLQFCYYYYPHLPSEETNTQKLSNVSNNMQLKVAELKFEPTELSPDPLLLNCSINLYYIAFYNYILPYRYCTYNTFYLHIYMPIFPTTL